MSDRNHDEDRYDDMKDRAEAAEANLVVQHQRFLDLDETLTAEIRAAEAERHELKNKLAVQQNWQTLYEREKTEVARLREALQVIPEAMDSCVEYMETAEREGLEPWSVAATTVRAHCSVVAEDVRAALREDA
jgi:hypothetical protein